MFEGKTLGYDYLLTLSFLLCSIDKEVSIDSPVFRATIMDEHFKLFHSVIEVSSLLLSLLSYFFSFMNFIGNGHSFK